MGVGQGTVGPVVPLRGHIPRARARGTLMQWYGSRYALRHIPRARARGTACPAVKRREFAGVERPIMAVMYSWM